MPRTRTAVVSEESTAWQVRAACRTAGGGWDAEPLVALSEQASQALAVCAACSVRETCLAFAMTTEPAWLRWGIWGGTTPDERRAIGRRR